jgi:hypothetical protein
MFTVTVNQDIHALCQANAEFSTLPKGEGWGDRTIGRRGEDQLVAQLGHWAFCYWKDGHDQEYRRHRDLCNAYRFSGDGGSDVIGLNVDVKTSMMRRGDDPWRYHLIERKPQPGTVYVLALVPQSLEAVHVMGWQTGEQMERAGVVESGPLSGCHCVPAWNLVKLPPFRWTR